MVQHTHLITSVIVSDHTIRTLLWWSINTYSTLPLYNRLALHILEYHYNGETNNKIHFGRYENFVIRN